MLRLAAAGDVAELEQAPEACKWVVPSSVLFSFKGYILGT